MNFADNGRQSSTRLWLIRTAIPRSDLETVKTLRGGEDGLSLSDVGLYLDIKLHLQISENEAHASD